MIKHFFVQADRSSVFPEGNNLNLLILVVVGASATASLLVGGLVLALTRRSKVAKKVNKLQLSDDVEDRGKMHEEYKVSSVQQIVILFSLYLRRPKKRTRHPFYVSFKATKKINTSSLVVITFFLENNRCFFI